MSQPSPPSLDGLESYRAPLRGFIASAFKGHEPSDDEDIFESGHVNSLFAMELVTFVEGTFDMLIDTDDLDLDNFRTIENLAAFVDRKKRTS